MSAENINFNERRAGENEVPEEALSLPNEVYEANWHDDVADEAEDETKEETSLKYEPFDNEPEYKSSEIVSRESENLIAVFNRERAQEDGRKLLRLYRGDKFKGHTYRRVHDDESVYRKAA